jgi:hypothetical protein
MCVREVDSGHGVVSKRFLVTVGDDAVSACPERKRRFCDVYRCGAVKAPGSESPVCLAYILYSDQ